jgi:hypothetical protein
VITGGFSLPPEPTTNVAGTRAFVAPPADRWLPAPRGSPLTEDALLVVLRLRRADALLVTLVVVLVVLVMLVARVVVVALGVEGPADAAAEGEELEDLEPPQPPRVTTSATMTRIRARALTLFSIDSEP